MKDLHKEDRKRCIAALVLSVLIILSVFIGVVIRLTISGDFIYPGALGLRYFTIQSNILMALCSAMCIPFEIDGLRNENYHLPRWTVNLMYVGTCAVTMTFTIVAVFLVHIEGVAYAFLIGSAPFVHFFTPVLSVILFVFINDDHRIHKTVVAVTLIPLILYGTAYGIEVFGTGLWEDHYHLNTYIPFGLAVIGMILIYTVLSLLLFVNHNKRHEKHKKEVQDYYRYSEEVSYPTIEEAIGQLAQRNRKFDRGGDVVVPRRIILMMNEKYHSDKNIEELCGLYLKYYMKEKHQ